MSRKANRHSQKLSPLLKMAENLSDVFLHFKEKGSNQTTRHGLNCLLAPGSSRLGNSVDNKLRRFFIFFSQKVGFDISCKLSPLNVKAYFLGKQKIQIVVCRYFYPGHFFPQKMGFDICCKLRRQFALNVKAYFLGKKFILSSADIFTQHAKH